VGIEPASSGSPNPFSGSSNPFSGSLTSKVVSPQDNQGVTQHLTWQELGISGDFLTAVRHESVAFLAPPGSTTFGRLAMEDITSSSSPGRQATITDVIGVPDGVVASVMVEAGVPRTVQTEYFHSSDGLAWQPWAAPAGMYVLDAVGTFEGQLYVAGAGMLARMEPGGSWTPIDIAGLVGEADQPDRVMVSVGPNGIAAVVEIVDAESGDGISRTAILSSRDGVTWQAWDLGDLIDRQLMTGDLRVGYVGDQIVINVQAMPAGRSSYDDAMELEPMTLVGTPT
jgi:hypothetical protein